MEVVKVFKPGYYSDYSLDCDRDLTVCINSPTVHWSSRFRVGILMSIR